MSGRVPKRVMISKIEENSFNLNSGFNLMGLLPTVGKRYSRYVSARTHYVAPIVAAIAAVIAVIVTGATWNFDTSFNGTQADEWLGESVAMDGDNAIVGASAYDASVNGVNVVDAGKVYFYNKSSGTWTFDTSFNGTQADESFGSSVAMDGDNAIVGAYNYDAAFANVGKVYFYDKSSGTWTFNDVSFNGTQADEYLGSSVAMDGDNAIAGAHGYDAAFANVGKVYFYDKSSGTWTFNDVSFNGTQADEQLGRSVAIDGDNTIAGANGHDDFTGKVYFYDKSSGTWTFNDVSFNGTQADERLGDSVAMDGDNAIAGALYYSGVGDDVGKVYFYEKSSGTWTFNDASFNGTQAGEQLGKSVAMDGDNAIAGANGYDASVGKVYFYDKSGGTWNFNDASFNGTQAGEQLGKSVAMDGDNVIVGAYLYDNDGTAGVGKIVFYERSGGTWGFEDASFNGTQADEKLGYSVAMDGDNAIAGAYAYDNGGTTDAGKVYFYDKDSSGNWRFNDVSFNGTQAGENLGASVAIDGYNAIAGAHGYGSSAGKVYFYDKSGGTWNFNDVSFNGTQAGEKLGFSVAMDEDNAIAGANSYQDGGTMGVGKVYFYDNSDGTWTFNDVSFNGTQENESLGWSVATDGDNAMAGALYYSGVADDVGKVYFYDKSGGTWRFNDVSFNGTQAIEQLGTSVAMDGDNAMAGANYYDASVDGVNQADAGKVYFYDKSSGTWNFNDVSFNGTQAGENLGASVAMDGYNAIAGASNYNATVDGVAKDNVGKVYFYDNSGGTWTFNDVSFNGTQTDDTLGEELGRSVAIDGNNAMAGAPTYDNDATTDVGKVYFYRYT